MKIVSKRLDLAVEKLNEALIKRGWKLREGWGGQYGGWFSELHVPVGKNRRIIFVQTEKTNQEISEI